ncbi:hypothetical protein ABGB16_28020 [Micromonospora sp. B11E3]|uniref:hypothetical protein n=1 Tax=Micromonospora sp. B11E3 TaxID=3153562 RepID=UPI00325D25AF
MGYLPLPEEARLVGDQDSVEAAELLDQQVLARHLGQQPFHELRRRRTPLRPNAPASDTRHRLVEMTRQRIEG